MSDLLFPANIHETIIRDLEAINKIIRIKLHSTVPLVNQIGEYIVHAGGKRIRPILVALFAQAHGYQGDQHHVLAAVIEFIHTATLLHDDVVDESHLRRGKKTANALFGNAASVLVGDFLYTRAFQMMVELNNMEVMAILADATNIIAEGEVLQLLNMHDPQVTTERYLHVIQSKTAQLFEAATSLGALIAGADPDNIHTAKRYGCCVGTAFQLIDDVLDYSGDANQIGKNIGDDLREGKTTLPLIYAMQHCSEKEREILSDAIKTGNTNEFSLILSIIQQSGAIHYTKQQAKKLSEEAISLLSALPATPFKDALAYLAYFSVDRDT